MQSALWIYGGQFGGVSRTHHAIRSSAGHKDKTASYNGFYCPTALSDTVHLPPPLWCPEGAEEKSPLTAGAARTHISIIHLCKYTPSLLSKHTSAAQAKKM